MALKLLPFDHDIYEDPKEGRFQRDVD